MQSCELCGRPGARLKANVAGTESIVCDNCASLGTIIEEVIEKKPSEIKQEEKRIETQKKMFVERSQEVVEDIGEQVRQKREELGLKQEELGHKISEHASMVKRIEHGYLPSLKIAHKLEKVLHLKLVEYVNPNEQEYVTSKSGGAMTLGDIMIIKKQSK